MLEVHDLLRALEAANVEDAPLLFELLTELGCKHFDLEQYEAAFASAVAALKIDPAHPKVTARPRPHTELRQKKMNQLHTRPAMTTASTCSDRHASIHDLVVDQKFKLNRRCCDSRWSMSSWIVRVKRWPR